MTHLLSLRRDLRGFLAFKPFFVVLLEVNFEGVEHRVKVNDVVVFDAEFCDLLRFIDLAVGRSNDTLDRVDPLHGALKIQRAVLASGQNYIECIDLEVLGVLERFLVTCTTSTFR